MQNRILRYLRRTLILAVIETLLVLCFISGTRLLYTRASLQNAEKYAAENQSFQVIRELRLAYRWSEAYPAFTDPLQSLYKEAVRQTYRQPLSRADNTEVIPDVPERRFNADIPPIEKSLILPDMLVNLIYKRTLARKEQFGAANGTAANGPSFRPSHEEIAERPAIAVHDVPYQGDSPRNSTSPDQTAQTQPTTTTEPAAADEPNAMWGAVTRQDAPVYDKQGKKTRNLPAGSLVDVHETRSSPDGEIILCSVWSKAGTFKDVYLRRDDVELYSGASLKNSSKEQRMLVSKRAEILGAIEARQKEINAAAGSKNPHLAEYRESLQKIKALNDEAETVKKEYESTTGARRMELGNRLRSFKNEQFVLMPAYQEIKRKKEEWDRANKENHPNPADDPLVRQLQQQLDTIDGKLRNV